MQYKNIIILILILLILQICTNVFLYKKSKKIENMSNVNTLTNKIKEIYQADVQAIRSLSEISQKLQNGGLTIPGNLTVTGNINCKKTVSGTSLTSTKNNSWIGYHGDGKNYIRSNTRMEGNIDTDLNLSGNLKLNNSNKNILINNDVIIGKKGGKFGKAYIGNWSDDGTFVQFSHIDRKDDLKGYAMLQNSTGTETLVNSKGNIRLRKNNNDNQSNVISGKISCQNISPTIIEPKINIKNWGDENEISNSLKSAGVKEGVIYPIKFCRLGNHRNHGGFMSYNQRNDGWKYFMATDIGHIHKFGRFRLNGHHSRGSSFDVNRIPC